MSIGHLRDLLDHGVKSSDDNMNSEGNYNNNNNNRSKSNYIHHKPETIHEMTILFGILIFTIPILVILLIAGIVLICVNYKQFWEKQATADTMKSNNYYYHHHQHPDRRGVMNNQCSNYPLEHDFMIRQQRKPVTQLSAQRRHSQLYTSEQYAEKFNHEHIIKRFHDHDNFMSLSPKSKQMRAYHDDDIMSYPSNLNRTNLPHMHQHYPKQQYEDPLMCNSFKSGVQIYSPEHIRSGSPPPPYEQTFPNVIYNLKL